MYFPLKGNEEKMAEYIHWQASKLIFSGRDQNCWDQIKVDFCHYRSKQLLGDYPYSLFSRYKKDQQGMPKGIWKEKPNYFSISTILLGGTKPIVLIFSTALKKCVN